MTRSEIAKAAAEGLSNMEALRIQSPCLKKKKSNEITCHIKSHPWLHPFFLVGSCLRHRAPSVQGHRVGRFRSGDPLKLRTVPLAVATLVAEGTGFLRGPLPRALPFLVSFWVLRLVFPDVCPICWINVSLKYSTVGKQKLHSYCCSLGRGMS